MQNYSDHYRRKRCGKCGRLNGAKKQAFSLDDWRLKIPEAKILDIKRVAGWSQLLVSCPSAKSFVCHKTRWVPAGSVKRTNGICHPCSRYKGGFITQDGYRRLYVNGQGVNEHRIVMEQIIGRPLSKNESVHHKNGIRSDNRPENLELRARYHGAGQTLLERIEDIENTCGIKIKHLVPARFKKIWG